MIVIAGLEDWGAYPTLWVTGRLIFLEYVNPSVLQRPYYRPRAHRFEMELTNRQGKRKERIDSSSIKVNFGELKLSELPNLKKSKALDNRTCIYNQLGVLEYEEIYRAFKK